VGPKGRRHPHWVRVLLLTHTNEQRRHACAVNPVGQRRAFARDARRPVGFICLGPA
jgi:hypothetical protein